MFIDWSENAEVDGALHEIQFIHSFVIMVPAVRYFFCRVFLLSPNADRSPDTVFHPCAYFLYYFYLSHWWVGLLSVQAYTQTPEHSTPVHTSTCNTCILNVSQHPYTQLPMMPSFPTYLNTRKDKYPLCLHFRHVSTPVRTNTRDHNLLYISQHPFAQTPVIRTS